MIRNSSELGHDLLLSKGAKQKEKVLNNSEKKSL